MAGDAVMFLENLLATASFSADRIRVSGRCAARIDGGRVNNEGDAKRAECGPVLDDAVSPKIGWRRQSCNASLPEEA